MVVAAALCVFLGVYVTATSYFARREGYYSTIVVFATACAIYNVAIPVELWIAGRDSVLLAHSTVVMEDVTKAGIITLAALACVGFAIGYGLSGYRPFSALGVAEAVQKTGKQERLPATVIVLVLLSLAVLMGPFREQVESAGTYAGAYTTSYNNPGYALAVKYATIGLGTWAAFEFTKRNWLRGLAIAAPVLLWGFYSSGKDPLLVALLAVGSVMIGKASRRGTLILIAVAGVITAGIGPLAFSQYRAGADISLTEVTSQGVFVRTDPAGPMVSLARVVSEPSGSWEVGATYLNSLVLWIPRVLWRSRPLDLAESFARDNMSGWVPGRGLGYALLAESYRNFGWLGPLLQYAMIGLAWGGAWRLVQRRLGRTPRVSSALYATFGFYLLVIMHRGPVSAIVTSLVHIFLPVLMIAFILERRWTPRMSPPYSITV